MTDRLRPILTAIAAVLALYVWGNCRESAGASKQRLRDSTVTVDAHRDSTDRRVAMLAAESLELGGKLRRLARNDSVARGEIARLTAGTIVPDSGTPRDTLIQQIAVRDSIIDAQDEALAASDSSLTIWRALAVERGELLNRALSERDAYRKISAAWQGKAGKRFGCTGGPGIVVAIDGHVSAGAGFVCGIRF